ncbi:mannose-6-phosphate isomerase isoform X2 [Anabrus simplex]|uniref:mannose-6-phosphate isomerase isoform X2 n=1 Tax=Anabrus simplex TaxID=316456 RepID=UPI0034DCD764
MELKCCVQQYAWGKIGRSSEVALLSGSGDPDFVVNERMPYAELWMGTHPNGPSVIKGTSQKLSDWIATHEESLGKQVLKQFGRQLPFLLKVLSVNKALSIQAHPNKCHAEQLHKRSPEVYKDPNHKPELAIALTPFEALCGFRPLSEIKHNLQGIPELRDIIGKEAISELLNSDEAGIQAALRKVFHHLMTCPKETLQTQLQNLLRRVETLDESSRASLQVPLLQRLHSDFPGDVGCFGIYFFNLVTLNPGESIYLGPNEPHAYLSGDCIECMACSDNVVRAGLTPKYKDVETLCNMLTYQCAPADTKKFLPRKEDDFTYIFSPPVPDFAVAKIMVPPGTGSYNLICRNSASIIIVIEGEAVSNIVKLKRGTIFYLPATEKCSVNNTAGLRPLQLYQAFANV